jgi:hypothetical protein
MGRVLFVGERTVSVSMTARVTGCLSAIAAAQVTTGTGFDIEKEAHSILSKYSCHGEWFDVSPELAMAAVTGAAARLGQPLQQVDEKTAALVLQIASGKSAPRKQSLGALDGLKIGGLTLLYSLIGAILLIVVTVMSGIDDSIAFHAAFLLPLLSLLLAIWKVGRDAGVVALVIASMLCLQKFTPLPLFSDERNAPNRTP